MVTYSRPRAPRSPRPAPRPFPTSTRSVPPLVTNTRAMPGQLQGPAQAQAQGRDVTSQGGQQGVVGRGGNFQPLGSAALSKLPAQATQQPMVQPTSSYGRNFMHTNPWSADVGAGGGDIQTAIQGLKSQLGEPADTDATRMAGMTGPNVQSMGPGIQAALAGAGAGAGAGSGDPRQGQPNPGTFMTLKGRLPGAAGGFQGGANPYAEILRQRLGAAGGGAGQLQRQYAY